MKLSMTIIAAAALLAGAMVFLFRWETVSSEAGLFRVNRLTGEIKSCKFLGKSGALDCADWR